MIYSGGLFRGGAGFSRPLINFRAVRKRGMLIGEKFNQEAAARGRFRNFNTGSFKSGSFKSGFGTAGP